MAGTKISDATTTTPVVTDMIPFARVADATARHTTIQRLLAGTGKIGIRTSTPSSQLSIFRALSDTAGDTALGFGFSTTLDVWGIRLNATTGNLNIDRNYSGWQATPALTIARATGKTGIGTDAPSSQLSIYRDLSDTVGNTVVGFGYSTALDGWGIRLNVSSGNFNLDRYYSGAWQATPALTIARSDGRVGIGLTPTATMTGLSVEAGLLTLKERALPSADTNYGKIWTESDNTLHFQDGAGTEYLITIVGV